ncbi:hypothetical protein BN1708_003842 [Verticillium longisporum]|uniref:phenylalanine--tRNA ligase n=1 Tax=Verticillium longisporum TaxID=100787 RepID=A0A0G4LRI4_VERLO|nr:hypothetical protein BN1708_003842 [Verticillium longisporum]
MATQAPPTRPLSSRRSTASGKGLSLDLSSLPPLTQPTPPSNTLLLTNLDDLAIFRPDNLQTIRDLIAQTAAIHSWAPLKSFRRIIVSFYDEDAAIAVRQIWNGEAILGNDEPLRMRWVEAYFPFTSPSWELEVYYHGDWLEVLGSGVVKQDIFIDAGKPDKLGWAFGIGLDRIAMLLFQIPDIRLFWSRDERFLGQFRGVSDDLASLRRFVSFSKYPACPKDVSFWLSGVSPAGGGGHPFHENDFMELVRDVAGDRVEDVRVVDDFTHPKTGRRSMCYRVNYRSLERTLTNEETNALHGEVKKRLVERLGVEIR